MTKIKAVIFDIGNVLIEWNPERHYDRRIGRDKREEMFAEIDLHQMNELVDQGAPFKETIYETARTHPKWEAEIRMWHDEWIEMAAPRITHSWNLLRRLREKSIPVFALTNFGVDSFAYAETQYPELKEFDRRYISGHMKVTKPSDRIYEMVEEDCGFDPSELLFADDRAENIMAAQRRGWNAHLFTEPEGLASCLVEHGLLSIDEARA